MTTSFHFTIYHLPFTMSSAVAIVKGKWIMDKAWKMVKGEMIMEASGGNV